MRGSTLWFALATWFLVAGLFAPEVISDVSDPEPAKALTNSLGMVFTLIPAGQFQMGSLDAEEGRNRNEGPRHGVKISRAFYLGTCEVTVGQFRQFVEATRYRTDAERQGGTLVWTGEKVEIRPEVTWKQPFSRQDDRHPVVAVSWNDARAFCDWLSKKEGVAYRLPSEAEWEYACRAGSDTPWWWGANEAESKGTCNLADASAKKNYPTWECAAWDDGHPCTSTVGSFRPNAFGLYDMAGNAWEWCEDWLGTYSGNDEVDPTGAAKGRHRVLRGGAWNSVAVEVRSAYRHGMLANSRFDVTGFRVVREAK